MSHLRRVRYLLCILMSHEHVSNFTTLELHFEYLRHPEIIILASTVISDKPTLI